MTSPRLHNLTLTLAAAASLAALTGCAGQGDIDRTQPDKVRKAIFFNADGSPKTFYFRQTFVNTPPTSAYAFEGTQGPLEKIKFKIDQNFLTAYRAYDYAPGSENPFTGGNNDLEQTLMVYPIRSHFDVKREYNAATGEQTNVISENTTDRPWDQREYMRVDWSQDLAVLEPKECGWDPMSGFFTNPCNIHDPSYVQETTMSDPNFKDRPIMTDDYIEFLQNKTYSPDYNACMVLYPFVDDGGPWDCGSAVVGVRNSFMAVKPSSYQPLEYPDTYPITDKSGNTFDILPNGIPCTAQTFNLAGGQYSGSDCSPASVDGFKKFGFFRTIVQTYDRNYGATEAGRKYYANRWNIWQDTDVTGKSLINADGTVRQVTSDQLKPKENAIIYYTNLEFPDDPALLKVAQDVTGDWNDAMKRTVGALQASAGMPNQVISADIVTKFAAKVPNIVVLKQNDCNIAEVQGVLKDARNATIAATVKNAINIDADSLDKAHLAQTCAILEAQGAHLTVTNPDKTTTDTTFTWQRNGDLRYSFFYWVDRPEPTMPLGYGPASADPQTGQIISASLYNYGAALDTYSQTSADMVELINNQISVDDLLSGKTITDVLKATAAASKMRSAQTLTPEARAMAQSKLPPLTSSGDPRLIPVPGGIPASKMSLIKGTQAEQLLMTPDILAAKLPMSKPGEQLTADQFAQASPANWLTPAASDARAQAKQTLAMNGCVYLGEFADDAILGLALKVKQETGHALWQDIRAKIFRGLADHEMGHTMGLRHNFSGSSDALNYNDQFWTIHENPKLTPEQMDQQSISEYRYSTVMDYGSRFNSDINGLGKYDYAAIRFGYGGLVDVMNPNSVNPDTMQNETGLALQDDILFNDYTKLPHLVGGAANLTDFGVLPYQTIRDQLSANYTQVAADLAKGKKPQGGFFITPERPYKFCSDEFIGNLDCKQWDFGANQQEIVNDTIDRFKNYFVFNAFKRGRLNWSIDGYLNRMLERYFIRYIEAFQFYYFYGPAFAGTDLSDDLLMASMNSLNALGEVLETPEPGEHCPTAEDPTLLALPSSPTGAGACLPNMQSMNIQIPDGKPYYINFSDDYYYRITRAGSLYEKLAALIVLTSTQAHFYRVDTFANASQYAINYYSVFKDEMLNLLSGVIRNDPASYGGYVPSATGAYTPTPVVDLSRYGQAKPPIPAYMQPGALRVATPVNKTIQYFAIGLSLANLDTSWDQTLDISNYLAVTVKGSKEDVNYAPGTQIIEYTHPQSGLTYRAPVLSTDSSGTVDIKGGIAAKTIQELADITGQPGVPAFLNMKYGTDFNNKALPDWYTAKAQLDAAKAAAAAYTGTDKTMLQQLQTNFDQANAIYQYIDQGLVAYRVDLLNDIRTFRSAFGL